MNRIVFKFAVFDSTFRTQWCIALRMPRAVYNALLIVAIKPRDSVSTPVKGQNVFSRVESAQPVYLIRLFSRAVKLPGLKADHLQHL
jgi:hypothetical protein